MALPVTGTLVVEALNSDGNSSAWDHLGGDAGVAVQGDFGSGTVKLQLSMDGGTTYVDVDSTTAQGTAAFTCGLKFPPCKLRVNISGSSSPDVDVYYSRYNKMPAA